MESWRAMIIPLGFSVLLLPSSYPSMLPPSMMDSLMLLARLSAAILIPWKVFFLSFRPFNVLLSLEPTSLMGFSRILLGRLELFRVNLVCCPRFVSVES